jgi:hypothetical protein
MALSIGIRVQLCECPVRLHPVQGFQDQAAGRAVEPEVMGEGGKCVGGAGQLQHPGSEEGEPLGGAEGGGRMGNCSTMKLARLVQPIF